MQGHNHPEHNHHGMMMKAVAKFDTCAKAAPGDETALAKCVATHLADMKPCVEGLETNYNRGLPLPVKIFKTCFGKLQTCLKDEPSDACSDTMQKCATKGRKKGAMKGMPDPLLKSIREFRRCKRGDKMTKLQCAMKYAKQVASMMEWAHLRRCQKGQFLCEALDRNNCLETLTGAKKCVIVEPVAPIPPANAPQKIATRYGNMAEALECLKTAQEGITRNIQNHAKYIECVYDSDYLAPKAEQLAEIRHVYCYIKLKSCVGETGTTSASCSEAYAYCRADIIH